MEEIVKATSMKQYYIHRQLIQQLYVNDVMYSGDLAGALLGLREQNKYIESMSLEIQSLRIRIELIQGQSEEECKEIFDNIPYIYSKLANIIDNYIKTNIGKVVDPNNMLIICTNIDNGVRYYDICHVGNIIEITL